MKTQLFPARHMLSLILFATAGVFASPAQPLITNPVFPPIVGGWTTASVASPEVVAAAAFAITAENEAMRKGKQTPRSRLTLIEIIGAQEQVVAGLNFRLSLEVNVNGTAREAVAVVFRSLSNKRELTSWNWNLPMPPSSSGIIGRVDEGTMTGAWDVEVFSSSGEWITLLQTGLNGSFEVNLAAGDYVLMPVYYPPPSPPGHVTPYYVLSGPATPVKVVADSMTFVVLPIEIALPPSQDIPGSQL